MKHVLTSLCLLGFLFSCQRDDILEGAMEDNSLQIQNIKSKTDLNQLILNASTEGRYFKWNQLTADDLWNAIQLSDNKVNVFWSMEDQSSDKSANNIEEIIESSETTTSKTGSPIIERSKTLNYVAANINNKETLLNLLNSEDVTYIEPLYEMISTEDKLAAERVSSYGFLPKNKKENLLDANAENPFREPVKMAFFNSNIDVAWNNGYDGKGITVAVIDNGPRKNHPLFGIGMSNNKITNPISKQTYYRSIEKKGFFKDQPYALWKNWDGVYETGISPTDFHGTSMLSVIGGVPNTDHHDDSSAEFPGTGVAYGANLLSIRSSRSVFIGSVSSRIGVRKAFESLIGRKDVKIISMSQGLLLWDEGIARAIRKNKDKLIFCAAGTFPEVVLNKIVYAAGFVNINFDRSSLSLFPSKMKDVHGVTGVNKDNKYCGDCYGKADFVLEFNDEDDGVIDGKDKGSSSVATASTAGMAALIWSTDTNLTAKEVYAKMKAISENPTKKHPNYGHGRLDMSKFNKELSAKVYVTLKGNNNRYVSSNNGKKSMECNRKKIGPWEKFELVYLSNGLVALKGSNGKYVSSENGIKPINCNRTSIDTWEKFSLIDFKDGTVGLKGNNGKYVSSEDGRKYMNCDRSSARSWEKFKIQYH